MVFVVVRNEAHTNEDGEDDDQELSPIQVVLLKLHFFFRGNDKQSGVAVRPKSSPAPPTESTPITTSVG